MRALFVLTFIFTFSHFSLGREKTSDRLTSSLREDSISKAESFIINLKIPKSCDIAFEMRKINKQGIVIDQYSYNENTNFYTASISKLLILLSVIHEVERGNLSLLTKVKTINPNEEVSEHLTVKESLKKMIESSSNFYAGISQRLLASKGDERGIQKTIKIIKHYGFGEGLFWVGAGYANGEKNSPGQSYNHEGTAFEIANFYQNIMNEQFPMKSTFLEILSESKINNRFYGELINSEISLPSKTWRKSGSWSGNGTFSDSIMFENQNNEIFILVLLTTGNSCISAGSESWHSRLIKEIY